MRRIVAASLAGTLAFAALSTTALAAAAPEAAIAFANHGGVNDWKADGTKGLWVQDRSRQWYYAELMGPCFGLNFANTLGFVTEPDGALNRRSSIILKDASSHELRCQFQTFDRSPGPPPPAKAKVDEPAKTTND